VKRRLSCCLLLLLGPALSGTPAQPDPGGPHAVVCNGLPSKGRAPKNFPCFSLWEEYRIREHRYWPAGDRRLARALHGTGLDVAGWKKKHADVYRPLDHAFAAELKRAKLLYVGQYSGGCPGLFADRARWDALKAFLTGGGTIVFDYLATTPTLTPFLDAAGVENPGGKDGIFELKGCKAVPWPEDRNPPLLRAPNRIAGLVPGYGWWEKWSAAQWAPLREAAAPDKRAVMIVQDNVLGNGRIIFSQAVEVFRERSELTDNFFTWIYGLDFKKHRQERLKQEGGPGEMIGVFE